MGATAPHKLRHARVLRYRRDVAADWSDEHDAAVRSFQGAVVALAIVEDEDSGGVSILFLYADGTVADEWSNSIVSSSAASARLFRGSLTQPRQLGGVAHRCSYPLRRALEGAQSASESPDENSAVRGQRVQCVSIQRFACSMSAT